MTTLEAWDEIMKLAIEHALVVAGQDGVVTLALPDAQKEYGWYERCQYNHCKGEHPKTIERRHEVT